ncbi:BON domain-containing protein [Burkholderia mayonis]|uniref:BON domain-containing protein n=1 Tax=Burkholderia mayonis TaxID=1385591 RepID=UPI001CF7D8DB|nr:BON domain-containing protein [Burkholderia mayonis]
MKRIEIAASCVTLAAAAHVVFAQDGVPPASSVSTAASNTSAPTASESPASSTSFASSGSPALVERRNWYGDPFFALSNAIAECPVPLGPLMTRAQMEDDAHYRVERGTTCWLAHRCSKPNSYLYDKPIAGELKKEFAGGDAALAGTSIWITIQRRFIYAEGCAPASFDRDALRRRLEALPDVEQVFIRLTDDPRGRAPYKTLVAPD